MNKSIKILFINTAPSREVGTNRFVSIYLMQKLHISVVFSEGDQKYFRKNRNLRTRVKILNFKWKTVLYVTNSIRHIDFKTNCIGVTRRKITDYESIQAVNIPLTNALCSRIDYFIFYSIQYLKQCVCAPILCTFIL